MSHTVDTKPYVLKFKSGDRVRTTFPFFSTCEGIVAGYTIAYDDQEGPRYSVNFVCGEGRVKTDGVIVLESTLTWILR
jgi:hypothetical protein